VQRSSSKTGQRRASRRGVGERAPRPREPRRRGRPLPPGVEMRYPEIGPPVPVGYINVPEWGLQTGRGKVGAYEAVDRGEVEVEYYGVACIREDWRERNAARAAAEAAERRRRHQEETEKRREARSAARSPETTA
jgi:hypothetical protein